MTKGNGNLFLVEWNDALLDFLQVMTALCAILHYCPGDEESKLFGCGQFPIPQWSWDDRLDVYPPEDERIGFPPRVFVGL